MSSTARLGLVLALGAVVGLGMRSWAGSPEGGPDGPEHGADVAGAVEGVATLVAIAPEGTRVKRGEVVAQLDSRPVRDRLDDQRVAAEQAEVDLAEAGRARAEAELALAEYRDAVYPLELQGLDGEIAVAQAALDLAARRYNLAQVPTPIEAEVRQAATVEFLRARTALRQAEGRRQILTRYTNPRRLRELDEALRRARALELSRQVLASRSRVKADRFRREIELCTLTAPVDGRVVRARTAAFGPGPGPAIGPGAAVVRGQVLVRVVPEEPR